MNRLISIALNSLEWLVPLVGMTRLGARRIVSVLLATMAHLVPILGCAFAGWDPVTILNIKVHLFSASEPTGGAIRIIHEAGNPHNAFADVPEERDKPRIMLFRGIIAFVLGMAAWWAIGRFFHG